MQQSLKQMEAEIDNIKAHLRGHPNKRAAARLRVELEALAKRYVTRREQFARSNNPTSYPQGILSPRRCLGNI